MWTFDSPFAAMAKKATSTVINEQSDKTLLFLMVLTCLNIFHDDEIKEVKKKIEDYEHFIEDRWQEVKQVVKTVREFKEKDRDMLVRLDIGCGIMATGEITDFERTYVDIGLGYKLEMDCDEADKYSDIRLKLLTKEIEHFRNLAVDVKVHIKLVLLAINELQASIEG
ncbi:hypothetical protein JTB14_004141 [Gonioctena quinquepunctata]|nr:hypothetical protein JTB14_004141 [Gonioctena quinquepunctata]